MKRILALVLAALTIFMCSCDLALQNESDTDADVRESASDNNQPSIKVDENSRYIIMPISKVKIKLEPQYYDFIPYITEELLEAAEKDIVAKKGKVEPRYCTFFTTNEGYLYIQEEYIKMVDPEAIANGYEQVPPCGDHWHSGCGGVISSQPLEKYVRELPTDTRASLKEYSDALVEVCGDALEESTGSVDDNVIFGGAVKVNHEIVKVDSSINLKKENTEAIIVFLRAKESERYESTLVITPKTMFVVTAGFGHPRQFSYLNNRWVITTQSAYMITEAIYERCNAYRDIIDTIKTNNAAAVEPESQFSGDLFYGFMNEESFEVYSHEKLLSILEANGYDTQAFDAFAESCIEIAEIKYENQSDEEDNTEDKDAEEVFDEAVAEK